MVRKQLRLKLKEDSVDETISTGTAAGLIAMLVAGAAGMKAKENFDQFKQIMHKVEVDKRDYNQLAALYQQDTGKSPKEARMDPEDLKIYAAAKELKQAK